MTNKPVVTRTPDVTDPTMRNHIRALTKMMIDPEDRTGQQIKPILRSDLPTDMRDQEGHVLDAIYYCTEMGIPPSVENVLGVQGARSRLHNPVEFVSKLIDEHKEDTSGIRELSAFIAYWHK